MTDLTINGRLNPHPFVTESKIRAFSRMISESNYADVRGDRAIADLRESLASTDAPFTLAYLANVQNLEQYDKAERKGSLIAATETVDDFKPATFSSFVSKLGSNLENGKGTKGNRVSPVVAEGDTYQYAFGYTEEDIAIKIQKRGFKTGVTLESVVNDPRRSVNALPGDMLEVALDTQEFLVFDALQSGVSNASRIAAGTAPISGASVPVNAPFSVDALRVAFAQIGKRKVNGNPVPLAQSYYVVVGSGYGEITEMAIAQAKALIQVETGTNPKLTFAAPVLGNLGKIAGVIESEWITTDGWWALVPAAGSTKRPSLVRLQLRGHAVPEIMVSGFGGTALGGTIGEFSQFHFDNDSVDFKLRQFENSGLITQDQLAWSNGSGTA